MIAIDVVNPFVFDNFIQRKFWINNNNVNPKIDEIITFKDIENKKWVPSTLYYKSLLNTYYEYLKFQSELPPEKRQINFYPFKIQKMFWEEE